MALEVREIIRFWWYFEGEANIISRRGIRERDEL